MCTKMCQHMYGWTGKILPKGGAMTVVTAAVIRNQTCCLPRWWGGGGGSVVVVVVDWSCVVGRSCGNGDHDRGS